MYAEYYKDIFTALCAVMQASLISEGHSMTYRRLTTKSGITFQHHV